MPVRYPKHKMISSLYQRNYRLFFFGQLISVAGTWMQTVAQSFLVLDLPHSGTQLGLTTAVRFAPMLVFGAVSGLFADRMNKRRVLYVTQARLRPAGRGVRRPDRGGSGWGRVSDLIGWRPSGSSCDAGRSPTGHRSPS